MHPITPFSPRGMPIRGFILIDERMKGKIITDGETR
jgi:hypothetical protein